MLEAKAKAAACDPLPQSLPEPGAPAPAAPASSDGESEQGQRGTYDPER